MTTPRHRLGVLAIIALVGSAGCVQTGLERIDARLDRLVQERSATINAADTEPRRQFAPRHTDEADRGTSPPPTTNPMAGDLSFDPADEARDVAERLALYAEASLGSEGDARVLTLDDALRLGQLSAREYLTAEESYLLDAIDLLIQRRLWGPRFFATSGISLDGNGNDGRFSNAVNLVQSLRVQQRLPYGGDVEAAFVWNATEQLREEATGNYTSSSRLTLSADIPLLRGAGLVAREDLIQAERDLVYAARDFERFRRTLLVNIANNYFTLIERLVEVENRARQIERLERLEQETAAKVTAGRIRPFERSIVANRLLAGRSALAQARENYILSLENFKQRLGLDPQSPIRIAPLSLELPEPVVSLDEATARGLAYRLDLQNARDRIADSARAVRNAENRLLPDLDVFASLAIPTDPDDLTGGLGLDPDEADYSVGAELGLPIDRDIERLNLRRSNIALDRQRRTYEDFRDGIVIDVRASVRNIELARFQLELAERAVEINRLRLRELDLRADETDAQTRVDAEDELLNSETARDEALTNLRSAILRYLLSTGQMRVDRDGLFEPLPGMIEPEPPQP